MALALLIDTSASMEQALGTAQEAAIGFAQQLGPADVATAIDFDSGVQTLQGFTTDRGVLQEAIRQTAAGGSTALYNAVYIALKELSKVTPQDDLQAPRRRAIVVLSDGEDTSSLVSFEEGWISAVPLRHGDLHDWTRCPRWRGESERSGWAIRASATGAADRRSGLFSASSEGTGIRLRRHSQRAFGSVFAGLRVG